MARNTRIELGDLGWVDYDMFGPEVRIADRVVPSALHVEFPGARDQPSLAMELEVVKGVPQCRSLTISAKSGSREVRTLDLRAVELENWIEWLFSLAASVVVDESADGSVTAIQTFDEDVTRQTARAIQQARSMARRKITPAFLDAVAKVYRDNADDRPVEAVNAAFGGSYRTAALYVQRARAAGLLPPTTPGRVTS